MNLKISVNFTDFESSGKIQIGPYSIESFMQWLMRAKECMCVREREEDSVAR